MDDVKIDFDPFRGGEIARTAPSTEPQREIITSAMMSPEANTAFNEAVSLSIRGPIEPEVIEEALRVLVERHDALRMTFTRAGDQLCVTDENRFALELRDLDASGDDDVVERQIKAIWRDLAGTPMDLFDGPLFRAVFVRRGRDEAELILLAHHLICDGWSFYVLLNELAALLAPAGNAMPRAATSFAVFAEREAAHTASNADIDFWLERFRDLPPHLELPTDRPRPALRSFAAHRTDFAFDAALTSSVKATAGRIKASVVNVALAGFAVLLHKLCKVEDLVIGLPVARQSTDNLHDLVGHGVQLLPIRLSVNADEPFAAVVARAKSAVLDAQEHPDFTFGTLVRELGLSGDGSRVPLICVIFNIDQPMGQLTLGEAQATVRTVPRVAENFEIFLNVMPAADALVVEATYNTDLFDEASLQAWLAVLSSILADVAADPQKAVSSISLTRALPEPYRNLNDTARRHDGNSWLEGLARRCSSAAGSVAACDRSSRLSYGDLDARSTQLARRLRRQGVGSGDLVGLYMKRSTEMLVAVAAVHKAGAGYLPLDPSFPESRILFMLEDSGAKLLLTDRTLPAALESRGIARLGLPLAEGGDEGGCDLPAVSAEDVAYVIYTSGSTGQPKGVRVHHGAVLNFLEAMASRPGMTADDRLLAVTTLSFDISVLELLLPLFCGGSVYVADREQAGDARVLEQLLADQEISIMQATPASWRLLLGHGWKGNPLLKALCGGEALGLDIARQLAARVGSLWNMYGPTETTIWSTCEQIPTDCERITIGRPIDNTQVYILAEEGGLMPPAVPGELCIAGAGVSKGYLERPELTAQKFIRHPQFGLVYRTGDRARLLPNGQIEHLGRIDDQVKVRGFRIELGEIEAALQEHPDIDRAAVHVWNAKDDDARIVACCILAAGKTIAPIQLRKHLRNRLPEYMIPQHFLSVDAIPTTPNGKIDRKSLPIPVVADSRIGRHEAPGTAAEAAIADIWTALVRPERPISRNDRFFEIGGHSLLGLEALQRMEERLGVRLHPRILFQENLAGIAGHCGLRAQAEASTASRPVPLSANERRLLSDSQELVYREVLKKPDTLRFHIPFSFRMSGPLDGARFEASLREVFSLHAALRTVIGQDSAGPYLDLLDVEQACVLERHDLCSQQDGNAAALALMVALTKTPFDVRKGPLTRMHLIRLAGDVHVFLFMPHQLVFDGWSFDLFLRDLAHHYAGGQSGRAPAAPSLAFSDYSTWQRTGGEQRPAAEAVAFWQEQLQHAPPPVGWPGNPAPAEAAVARVQFTIPADRMREYERACKQQGVKLSNLVLAAFVRTLAAATAQNDVLLGVANSGRFLPEAATIVGPFYRNLPFRLRIPKNCSAGALLELVERRAEKTTEFQDATCGLLADLAGSPDALLSLGKVTFSFQEARARRLEFADIELKQISVARPDMQPELEFWVRNTPDGLVASLDYHSELADRALIEAIRDDFTRLLGTLAESAAMEAEFKSQSRLAGTTSPRQGGGLLRRFGRKASGGR